MPPVTFPLSLNSGGELIPSHYSKKALVVIINNFGKKLPKAERSLNT